MNNAKQTYIDEINNNICPTTHSSELSEIFFDTLEQMDCIQDPMDCILNDAQDVIDILTSNIDTLWVIDCAILVFIMQAGLCVWKLVYQDIKTALTLL